jgi:hypothetical protein
MVRVLHKMGRHNVGSFLRFRFIDCNTLRVGVAQLRGPPTRAVYPAARLLRDERQGIMRSDQRRCVENGNRVQAV